MSLVIGGATIIDGLRNEPLEGHSLWIEQGRIRALAPQRELEGVQAERLDATGKFVIPGLMDANVHLLEDMRLENLARYEGRYEDLIVEAAQVALRNGLTTVFDTAGPRVPLMAVRDRINRGEVIGSRFFCAGSIMGLDGPFSRDFNARALDVASAAFAERMNAMCVENVGPALSWMSANQVAAEVRAYIEKGIDFVKYASSEHRWGDPTTFLVFSPQVQAAIVEEAHRAGLTAQAHASSVESLRVAVEAGCDLVQHCNITGPFPIPDSTLEQMVKRRTGAVVFAFTQRRFDWIIQNCPTDRPYFSTSDDNCRTLMKAGALILPGSDAGVFAPEMGSDPSFSKYWLAPGEDNLIELGQGHFHWLKAMEEKGMPPMDILRAATRNVAVAYRKDADLGTLEPGKIADLLVLDENPLLAARNYRSIHLILKEGRRVDRERLPLEPILTRPMPPPSAEVLAYRAHRHIGRSGFPVCPMCADH